VGDEDVGADVVGDEVAGVAVVLGAADVGAGVVGKGVVTPQPMGSCGGSFVVDPPSLSPPSLPLRVHMMTAGTAMAVAIINTRATAPKMTRGRFDARVGVFVG
jgi:hypothetical protein